MTRPIVAKLAAMRKPQKFVVYPRANDRAPVIVQSERAIGQFDPLTREGVLNWRGPNAKYFHHLSPAVGAEAYTFPADFVAQAVAKEPNAGDEVGPGIYAGYPAHADRLETSVADPLFDPPAGVDPAGVFVHPRLSRDTAMHEHDRYDQLHAELASGEGMPEAHQPQPRPDTTRKTFTSGTGTTPPDGAAH